MKRETVLPKNIRQIGEIQQDKKVYLEDYAITFIRRVDKERGEKNCSGVLVGAMEQEGEDSFVFVRGALLLNEQEEPEKRWKLMEEEKEKYFPDSQLIGCFILGALEEPYILEMMGMLPQPPFLIFHLQEGEETVYWSRENEYQKLKGFFVFYERNPQMQKYMAEHCEPREVEKEEGNSDQAIISFRKKVTEKGRQGKAGGMKYLASSFLVLTILVLGVTIINNYDKMKRIEETMSRMAQEQTEAEPVQAEAEAASAQTVSQDGKESQTETGSAAQPVLTGEVSQTGETQEDAARSTQADTILNDTTQSVQGNWILNDGSQPVQGDSVLSGTDTSQTASGESGSSQAGEDGASQTDNGMNEGAGETGTDDGGSVQTGQESQNDESLQTSSSSALTDFADTITSQPLQERNYSLEDPEQVLETEALGKTDEVLEASSRQSRSVYTIRYGDTLADISAKYYGSLDKVEEICELNGIDDANMIVPGEKIVLP